MDASRAPARIEARLQALKLAQACAELGARVRTIAALTGLPARELLELLFPDRQAVPRGRPPASPDWYHTANLLNRAEASIAMVLYRRLCDAGFPPPEALVGAYRHYRGVCEPPHRISFDRAFDLAGHTDGLWFTTVRSFSLVACPACHSTFLAACGTIALSNEECPFCKLVQRYGTDPRVQASFPVRPLADLSGVPLGVRELLRDSTLRSAADVEGGDRREPRSS
ncbi:FlhC family transcriptional regulator [Azohydromonas aeria]|uniref:FlhC family transcriptional regulator n=1 Tax=Azohydromonas aeria TaxID=2590212 RepID=UPI0012F9AA1B|nr:FlhC family transcriptional regulator [Azohydromonas aeria]